MAKAAIEKYKSFEKWKSEEVEEEFGVIRKFDNPAFLTNFLTVQPNVSEVEKATLLRLQARLIRMADAWNEFDMSIIFIAPVLELIDLQQDTYRTFFNHALSTTINNKEIKGRVDAMLAKGRQIAKSPIFFLQEYKQESGTNNDPMGQLLIEMYVAQHLNKEPDEPIYGCYIVGRNWFFVVLQGKEYAVSDAYVATQADLFEIVAILKKVKILFEKKINN
jgi:hypothetical protein